VIELGSQLVDFQKSKIDCAPEAEEGWTRPRSIVMIRESALQQELRTSRPT
jgi:hypothetical protein